VASTGSTYVWAQFTWAQVEAILAVASGVDRHGELSRHLPSVGERAAFRAAITTLTTLHAAAKAAQIEKRF